MLRIHRISRMTTSHSKLMDGYCTWMLMVKFMTQPSPWFMVFMLQLVTAFMVLTAIERSGDGR